jgi:hypothetical protein
MDNELFIYSTNTAKVLVWEVDKHGFVQVEIVNMKI